MVLKIEQTSSNSHRVLMLAGKIGSDAVQMLKACIGDDDLLALDLSQV